MPQISYMNIKVIATVCTAAVLMAACNNSSNGGAKSTAPVTLTIPDANNSSPAAQQPLQPQNGTPVTMQQQPVVTSPAPNTNSVAASNSNVKLNPEHGQPGHRCDIAVGAPLDGKPAPAPVITQQPANISKTNPVTVSMPQPTEVQKTFTTPATNTGTTKAGLNPEHGKPGHRCDIAVGAPLDSKPAATPSITTTPANNTANATPTIAQPITPVLPNNNATTAVPADGLNPEHGKPGHRCDIAVGAPLNSKPVEIKKEKE